MTDALDFQPADLERHRAFLRRLARGLVRGEAAAEDLVQETFVRALERPPESGATLGAWLARVARRLALDRGRGERRSAAREQRAARPEAVPPHDQALASLELQERLVAAVKALPEPYRTTLWLRFHEGLTPSAIAAREATSKKTIESRLTRGLALLRSELDRQSGGDRRQWLSAVALLASGRRIDWLVPVGVGVMKKTAVAALALLVLGVAWRWTASSRPPSGAEPEPPARSEALVASPVTSLAPAQRAVVDPGAALALSSDPLGGLRIRVLWSDRTPAADVGLFIFPEDDPLGERQVVRMSTDDQGGALVEHVHPGAVRIEADRGPKREASIEAGRETELEFELPLGVDVRGTVTDSQGAPIQGAEILLDSGSDDWLATRVVARTGPNGSYAARSVDPSFSVSARAGESVPAYLEPLRGRSLAGGAVQLDFVLGQPGLGLRGIVLDPDRQPMAGARVAVGDPGGYFVSEESVVTHAARGLALVVTDAMGRFDARGVEQSNGDIPVAVMAAGFPVRFTAVAGALEGTSHIEIVLERPATLLGYVRDWSGEPVVGAHLAVLSLNETAARELAFPLPSSITDDEGAYRLELLPPGQLTIRVDPRKGSSLGSALATIDCAPGEAPLDITLPADDTIRGRVEDDLGRPVAARALRWTPQNGSAATQRSTTAGDGRFTLPGCSAPPYTLEILDERTGRRPLLVARDVGPSSTELVLRLERLASLTGTFVDEAGLFGVETPSASLVQRDADYNAKPEWTEHSFRFDELAPGTYHFVLSRQERLVLSTDWIALGPGEQRDLGVLRSEEPGRVVLDFETYPDSCGGGLLDSRFEAAAFVELEGTALALPPVPPGEYTLDFEVDGQARICEPVLVIAGQTTHVHLTFEPGIERTLTFPLADPAREWSAVRITVRGPGGRLYRAQSRERKRIQGSASTIVSLPRGTFEVEAVTDTGLTARGRFTVEALSEQDAPLVFELR